MLKFAVELTKGDTDTIIRTFETRDAAMEFGQEYWRTLPKGAGVLCCVMTDFDAAGQRTSSAERVYHVWC